jgi:hypothetical protein
MPALAHFGLGFAAKRLFPEIPLWGLLISVIAIDLLSGVFIFAIWISHGLFMSIFWSLVAMIITAIVKMRQSSTNEQDKINKSTKWKTENLNVSTIIGLLVFSHWILDFVGWPMTAVYSSATGVPIFFDNTVNIGLGVYSTLFGALLMDIGIFVLGLAIYVHYKIKIS